MIENNMWRQFSGDKLKYGSIPVDAVTVTVTVEAIDSRAMFLAEKTGTTETNYRVYSQRWVVLLAFSFLSLMNDWIWITWSPLTVQVADHWEVPISAVNDLSAVYMYIYIPLSFPALYFLNRYKLRTGLILGGSLNFLGASMRYWGMSSYFFTYCGTVVCAMCQTLTLAMPPLISTLWFREKERGLSTSLGVLANQLGTALGLGVTIACKFVTTSEYGPQTLDVNRLGSYLLLQSALSGLSLFAVLFFVRSDAPPTPPSEAANLSHSSDRNIPTYWESIRLLLSTRSGWVLCVVYGMTIGVLYAVATFLSQFFRGEDRSTTGSDTSWSEAEIGSLGLDLILAGLAGTLLSGQYLDRTRSSRGISIGLLVGSLLAMLLFSASRRAFPGNRGLAYAATGLSGFFLTGFISTGFEYGTAICYPADEAAAAGVMNVAAQIGGWALVSIGGHTSFGREAARFGLDGVFIGTLLTALILFTVFVSAKSKRPG